MLIRFNVKNFLSFFENESGQSEEFSMIAGKVRSKREHIYDNDKIKLNQLKETSYTIAEVPDVTRPYLLHRYVTFSVDYEFVDYTSANEEIPYYVTGVLTLERNINTQIPDEDQAIEW